MTASQTVHAMLVGMERMATAMAAWLVNIKPILGLRNALVADLANIPPCQQSAVLIVQQAPTRQTIVQIVCSV